MQKIPLISEIIIETTAGNPVLGPDRKPLVVSQRDFLLLMLGEPQFVGRLKGIHAARAVARAKADIENAFGEGGDGAVSDDTAERLKAVVDSVTVQVSVSGRPMGPAVQHSFLPFMEAVLAAEVLVVCDPIPKAQAAE